MTYCSLAEARLELKAVSTASDDQLMDYISKVCARIDGIMSPRRRRPYFEPYQERRSFRMDGFHISSLDEAFWFREPLLALTSLVADGTTVTSLLEAFPQDERPILAYRFLTAGGDWYSYCTSDRVTKYAAITGLWGWHSDYSNAWQSVDALTAAINASVTTIAVSNTAGDDLDGLPNRISRGHLLQIGSSAEIMYVSDVPNATSATIKRGVNGTTAEAHSNADAVKVFKPELNIRRVVSRQAAMLYARQGAFQVEQMDGIGTVSYPQDLLSELKNVLTDYMY